MRYFLFYRASGPKKVERVDVEGGKLVGGVTATMFLVKVVIIVVIVVVVVVVVCRVVSKLYNKGRGRIKPVHAQ